MGSQWRQLYAHREKFKLSRSGIDELVGGIFASGRARDHVAGANRVGAIADANLARSFEDEEHFLIDAVFYDLAASPDKDFYVIEGASHGGTPCTECEQFPGQYSNTVKKPVRSHAVLDKR